MRAIMHAANIQGRDGGMLLMASLFGLCAFLFRLCADNSHQMPILGYRPA